jgi:1-acyl-sn-glycerol-3-phosphate acyltransferase
VIFQQSPVSHEEKRAMPDNRDRDPSGHANEEALSVRLLAVIRELATELHARRRLPPALTLDTDLEHDLGLDSLARLELLTRLERQFDTQLPEAVLVSAETPRDLLRALGAAKRVSIPHAIPVAAPPAAGTVDVPRHSQTLIETLLWHASATPQRPHIHIEHDDGTEETISYRNLLDETLMIAAGLRERDLQPGQCVAIMLPTGREYFACFFGVLAAGGIPVPVYPPLRPAQIEEHLRRHARLLDNALAVILITVPAARGLGHLLRAHIPGMRLVVTSDELRRSSASAPLAMAPHPARGGDVALLQYTSGSTGNPKGVILTHANLLANIRVMGDTVQATPDDVFVSWMPLYHDMGLIGAWLGSLYFGMPLVVMSPLTFIARPHRWLWAIHRHRATLSGAPNFGYELCLRRIDDAALAGLDLSSWRIAFNGAEPVSPDTLERFTARFAPFGLRPETLFPVYGLAESSVGLTFPPPGRGPLIDRVRRESFMTSGRAVPAAPGDESALRFVACGLPLPGHQIRIVDVSGNEAGERQEGRLEFMGPSVTSGYFRNPEATRALFHGDWLDSGDLAYIAGGDVYITGRVKDIIIRAGRNIYPHELEENIGNIPGIRKGCVAVFGVHDPVTATERLVVLAETRETDPVVRDRLSADVNSVITDLIGAPPDEIVLAPPHTVLKTSSGKVRRSATHDLYVRSEIGAPAGRPWWQIVRFAWLSVTPEFRRARHAAADWLYAIYVWMIFALLAPMVWSIVALIPRPRWNRMFIRHVARLFLKLSGVRLQAQGFENLPDGPCVIVANHASYIDGIILSALFTRDYRYVAKSEFVRQRIAHRFLTNIGAEFVERSDRERGIADIRRLAAAAHAGGALVFFPEGTFLRMPGLLPFRLGAFSAAVESQLPVVPIALRGTRSVLRGDQWFPRRGAILVSVLPALKPDGHDWQAALRLRDTVRNAILQRCGEPDLA